MINKGEFQKEMALLRQMSTLIEPTFFNRLDSRRKGKKAQQRDSTQYSTAAIAVLCILHIAYVSIVYFI